VTAPRPPAPRPPHQPATRFVLRTPLLPFAVIGDWTANGGDLPALRAHLRRWLDDPAVREAVFVASPELDAQLGAWIEEPDSAAGQGVERAVVRYLSRMAARATPFGLFSGVSVGAVAGADTRLALPARAAYRRHTRLDNDYLFAACGDLARTPAVRAELRHLPNSSLYRAAGRLRYAEARLAGDARAYHLVAVDPTDYLDAVLAVAARGATPGELADVLCADPEVTREEADAFVTELIETQVVVPALAPPVTGREPTACVVDVLAALPAGAPAAATLGDVARRIAAIDETPPGGPTEPYRAIATALGQISTKVDPKRLFQVDLFKPTDAVLGAPIVAELGRAIELLARLTPNGDEDALSRFKQAFQARYETREVPLVEVLDEEAGIGFADGDAAGAGAPLIADLAFPGRPEPRRVPLGRRESHLMQLVTRAIRAGAPEIELTDDDLEALAAPKPAPLADAVAVSAVIAAPSPEALADGRYTLRINGVDGGPGARLLGRFCHGSAEVTALTAELCAAEHAMHPDAVFAEIVHLPEGRIGNILLRPVLRPYEIVYLGTSGAPADHQIPVTDLLVSIVRNAVVLRSRRLGVRVLPRMTTAHNYSARSLGVYRFLCTLGQQEGRGAYWSWGLMNEATYLPRLRRGRFVLSRQRWILTGPELAPLVQASKGKGAARTPDQIRALRARQVAAVAAIRAARGLPRWIVVADGDNELAVDLDNTLMVESFVDLVKGRAGVTLHEQLPDAGELCVTGPEGAFVHEIVVPFHRVPAADAPAPPAPPPADAAPAAAPIGRRFPPGSTWLYAKIYTGTATADVLLREAIGPLVRDIVDSGHADRWFFIRYADPDWHLRLRFAGDPARLSGEVLPRLHAALAAAGDAGLWWRLALDTYEREVERYGGPAGVELAEQLFCADSAAVLAIVEASGGDTGADAAWRLCLRGVDRLLGDLGFDLATKLAILTRMRDEFGAEHGMDTAFQKRLGEKFRAHKAEIAELLAAPDDAPDHPFAPGLAALAARSTANAPIAAELRARAGTLAVPLEQLAPSYVHMHANRMLSASARRQEVVLYDLLRRHYDGEVARARRAGP
jgi:thiopeptide-type bacteriocin biosynthesis protein